VALVRERTIPTERPPPVGEVSAALISQIYFWRETLHVSDSSSVHHQELIHSTLSNGICVCHTGL